MDKVESLKCMLLLNTSKKVDATLLAGKTLDDSALVNDGQLILVGCGLDFINGNDADNGEESACWLLALGTSACMVVQNVASNRHLHYVAFAMAMQFSTRKVVVSLSEAIIN